MKNFVLKEIEQNDLTTAQKEELEKRLIDRQNNPNSGEDAFEFLDSLKTKYQL